jgi:hypothetical protein
MKIASGKGFSPETLFFFVLTAEGRRDFPAERKNSKFLCVAKNLY